MRNYFKLNVSFCQQFDILDHSINSFFFWHDDDPDYLQYLLARQATVLSFTTVRSNITTIVCYVKLNLQEYMDALNLPGGAGTPVVAYDILSGASASGFPGYNEAMSEIFVAESPKGDN